MDSLSARDIDYETADGSQFSLREIWTNANHTNDNGDNDNKAIFEYTSITAHVNGVAYTGKLPHHADEIDDSDVLSALKLVPPGCVHPRFDAEKFTKFEKAPQCNSMEQRETYFFKAPSFTYSDCQPGKTFIADCFANEIAVLERLAARPHPNIVSYHGCVVNDEGYVTHLCLRRYSQPLGDYVARGVSWQQSEALLRGVERAVGYLHSLGLAHNDVIPDNVCVDETGEAVLVDFDACLPFGERLMKGINLRCENEGTHAPISSSESDFHGLGIIDRFLCEFEDT